MIAYDFEVFVYDWLVVFKDIATNETNIIINDDKKLKEFYDKHQNNVFVGYNNKSYDDIIFRGILSGVDPYTTNVTLMSLEEKYKAYKLLNIKQFPLISVDLMQDILGMSLKQGEGYMKLNVDECTIPFNIERPLTEEEIQEVVKYCCHDVDATVSLLEARADYVNTKLELIKLFHLKMNDLSCTNAQLCAKVLEAKRQEHDDELYYDMPDTVVIDNPTYRQILDLYVGVTLDYTKIMTLDICGVSHTLAYGGIHAGRKNFSYVGEMWHIDVNSYYPSLMIRYGFHSRNIKDPERFVEIYHDRIKAKKEGNKAKASALKLVINTTYGCMKSKYSALYDPKMANQVCITGQLLFVDLLEKLEPYITLVQSNTDGIIVIPKDKDKVKEIVKEWETRTGMTVGIDIYTKIYQKDVNNYIIEDEYGNIETKGAYVKQFESNGLRNTTRILDKAVVNYFLYGTKPEDIIKNEKDVFMFQYITKTGRSYGDTVWETKDGLIAVNNVNRVYASKKETDGKLLKIKEIDGITIRCDSIASLPEHCVVDNTNQLSLDDIDLNWYISEAYKRINDFKGGE